MSELATLTDYEIGRKGTYCTTHVFPQEATHYQSITWEAAFDKIANTLNGLNSPDEAVVCYLGPHQQ